jgi:hypothetical protein
MGQSSFGPTSPIFPGLAFFRCFGSRRPALVDTAKRANVISVAIQNDILLRFMMFKKNSFLSYFRIFNPGEVSERERDIYIYIYIK